MSDSIPVLCISGQVSTAVIGTNAFQESDALGMSRPVTKWNHQPRRPEDVAAAVRRALEVASTGRPGPVLLDVPKDVQLAHPGPAPPSSASAAPAAQQRAAAAFGQPAARGRPAVDGAPAGALRRRWPDQLRARGLRGFHAAGAPARRARHPHADGPGRLPGFGPRFLGMLGMHGTLEANLAMHHADLVVCVGARFDDRVTGTLSTFCPHARKIHIDIDASSIGKVVKVDAPLVGRLRRPC
jgi:acetolactate synthase-1/2/3 large subunit